MGELGNDVLPQGVPPRLGTVAFERRERVHVKRLDLAATREWLSAWAVWCFENTNDTELWTRAKHLSVTTPFDPEGKRVYFIKEASGRFCKVGVTRDIADRIAALQTSNPHLLECVATTPGGVVLEAAIHQALGSTRASGEWFRLSPELVSLVHLLLCQLSVRRPRTVRDEQRIARRVR